MNCQYIWYMWKTKDFIQCTWKKKHLSLLFLRFFQVFHFSNEFHWTTDFIAITGCPPAVACITNPTSGWGSSTVHSRLYSRTICRQNTYNCAHHLKKTKQNTMFKIDHHFRLCVLFSLLLVWGIRLSCTDPLTAWIYMNASVTVSLSP